MNGLIYLIGLIVVIMAVLSLLGLQRRDKQRKDACQPDKFHDGPHFAVPALSGSGGNIFIRNIPGFSLGPNGPGTLTIENARMG